MQSAQADKRALLNVGGAGRALALGPAIGMGWV